MEIICIYCGNRKATTKDHVPPKCLFPLPRPGNLITVPCCEICNTKYGKDDERVRNLLTSLKTTEKHSAIKEQIAKKRDRSYIRLEGRPNLRHIIASVEKVRCHTSGGIYLGKALAFNLDQPTIDRFIERMARALLYHENGIANAECHIVWKMAPEEADIVRMPPDMKAFILGGDVKDIGEGVFSYVGYFYPERVSSLWLLNFYSGIEFMIIVRDRKTIKKHR